MNFAALAALSATAFGLSRLGRFPEGAQCGRRFGPLTAATRNKLPDRLFGLPRQRRFPMPDSSHASNAKARARQALNRRSISRREFDQITRKADSILKQCGGIPKTRRPLRKQKVSKRCVRFKMSRGVRRCAKFRKVA